jgi:hypothetical protein
MKWPSQAHVASAAIPSLFPSSFFPSCIPMQIPPRAQHKEVFVNATENGCCDYPALQRLLHAPPAICTAKTVQMEKLFLPSSSPRFTILLPLFTPLIALRWRSCAHWYSNHDPPFRLVRIFWSWCLASSTSLPPFHACERGLESGPSLKQYHSSWRASAERTLWPTIPPPQGSCMPS